MESVFLACFLFGALFTVASVALGAAGAGHGHGAHTANGHDPGLHGHGAHTGNGPNGAHAPATHGPAGAPAHAPAGSHADGEVAHGAAGVAGFLQGLPLLNFSSLVAFLTWFGAAGFVLTRYAGWAGVPAVAAAVVAGLAGALLIATFLARVQAGERVMDARQYRLPGTLARVTVSIPASGVGEIVFVKGGVRRSEAARSRTGEALPRDAQVVIMDYGQGVAAVQSWEQLLAERPERPELPELPGPSAAGRAG